MKRCTGRRLTLLAALLATLLFVSTFAELNWQPAGDRATAVGWQAGDWALGCDFNDNDFARERVPGEQCMVRCKHTPGCSHYTWTTLDNGTCWMKGGAISKLNAVVADDPSTLCGIIPDALIDPHEKLVKGELLWSDEFDSLPVFEVNWRQEYGGHGWGNNESQFYTNNNDNIAVHDGVLTIQTRLERKEHLNYTSARLKSRKSFRYGIFEMRAKLPVGRGTWPAFWLLAAGKPNWKWPDDGEIDVMEHVGWDPNVIVGTIHCLGYSSVHHNQRTKSTRIRDAFNEFHVYQLDWRAENIRIFVDDQLFFKFKREEGYDKWPFDNRFEIVLNTAVGGPWGGRKGIDNSVFPANYTIDYVRYFAN